MSRAAERARELARMPQLITHNDNPAAIEAARSFIARKRDEHRLMLEKALAVALLVVELDNAGMPLPIELDEELACFEASLAAYGILPSEVGR